jgi:hypothetical protein
MSIPQIDLFAFVAPRGNDFVVAVTLPQKHFSEYEREPLTVRLHAGTHFWTIRSGSLRSGVPAPRQ